MPKIGMTKKQLESHKKFHKWWNGELLHGWRGRIWNCVLPPAGSLFARGPSRPGPRAKRGPAGGSSAIPYPPKSPMQKLHLYLALDWQKNSDWLVKNYFADWSEKAYRTGKDLCFFKEKKIFSRQRLSIHSPLDLKSNALPLSHSSCLEVEPNLLLKYLANPETIFPEKQIQNQQIFSVFLSFWCLFFRKYCFWWSEMEILDWFS